MHKEEYGEDRKHLCLCELNVVFVSVWVVVFVLRLLRTFEFSEFTLFFRFYVLILYNVCLLFVYFAE